MASGKKLLEKMRGAPAGHVPSDFERLFTHYGFKKREGKNHTTYRHELQPPGAVVTVPRHRPVKPYVARQAVAAIDFVVAVENEKRKKGAPPPDEPPPNEQAEQEDG